MIKTKNPGSTAIGRIENEAKWLKTLNKYKIGPKLNFYEDGYFVVYGRGILKEGWLENTTFYDKNGNKYHRLP